MAEFHFVEDYEKHVARLMRDHPLDEAMSLAVGGAYDIIGRIEAEALIKNGLRDGMRLADIGCGSGRTAVALARRLHIDYDGYDIVQALLDYAATKTPRNYKFHMNRAVKLPNPDATFDYICAFSLFTHLLHEETFIYMRDSHRVLKKGGKLLFSFLEFHMPPLWQVFEATVTQYEAGDRPHLNMFLEREAIKVFAAKIGFDVEKFIDANAPILEGHALGQSICVMVK
ncbi:MAG: class I SAM-dependent methyltransferase [Mesorhizobium sp.]|uniref:class I SAM-dependent methyltransferase n=1 Tax=unclassified Mesorhizobium TaxID=325217 RepID=UPI000FC9A124|nr:MULTISPECIES: class I SAM-dependent methyltransferase [unclassified Mesorhizobium]RVD18671.1 class I SAM-dependent methyltransferase [Mesorhizobium sp. M7A.F.Ca.ET.027.02.1.1]RVD65308.1 class I SAM-dependent methyltransferase [Mesorhizobium sp. M7A.F.Ca.ET.027.03.2.1]RWD10857.1 MAG: class I SAM-dependent methyltransferase [Mesorhizobium sp.]